MKNNISKVDLKKIDKKMLDDQMAVLNHISKEYNSMQKNLDLFFANKAS